MAKADLQSTPVPWLTFVAEGQSARARSPPNERIPVTRSELGR